MTVTTILRAAETELLIALIEAEWWCPVTVTQLNDPEEWASTTRLRFSAPLPDGQQLAMEIALSTPAALPEWRKILRLGVHRVVAKLRDAWLEQAGALFRAELVLARAEELCADE